MLHIQTAAIPFPPRPRGVWCGLERAPGPHLWLWAVAAATQPVRSRAQPGTVATLPLRPAVSAPATRLPPPSSSSSSPSPSRSSLQPGSLLSRAALVQRGPGYGPDVWGLAWPGRLAPILSVLAPGRRMFFRGRTALPADKPVLGRWYRRTSLQLRHRGH